MTTTTARCSAAIREAGLPLRVGAASPLWRNQAEVAWEHAAGSREARAWAEAAGSRPGPGTVIDAEANVSAAVLLGAARRGAIDEAEAVRRMRFLGQAAGSCASCEGLRDTAATNARLRLGGRYFASPVPGVLPWAAGAGDAT
jgi:hypothetical protein